MNSDDLAALLQYRMAQANETLREAGILLKESAFRGTVNRSYYAMFYALLAVLATKQLGTSKHSGALALFDREFVKPGLFPRELSRSVRLAFNLRQRHDYGEMVEINRQIAKKRFQTLKHLWRPLQLICTQPDS